MSFTVQQVVDEVRRAIQDTGVTGSYRYDDTHIVGVVNQSLKRIALLRPDLFSYVTTMSCAAGTIQVAPADSIRLIDILLSGSGGNVNEVNRETLDLMYSTWQTGTTGAAQDWMRHVRSPNRFFVYPPSAAGQQLTIEYAQCPPPYAITDTVLLLGDAYFPAVVDCAVWLLESVDNEHVNSGRAKMMFEAFNQLLGTTSQNKNVTDFEPSNLPPQQVT